MWKRAFAALGLVSCVASSAAADDTTAYCRSVEALADSEGALLWSPKLSLEGLRYPSGFDNGPTTTDGYQLRVGISYSLLDVYRAIRLRETNEADCAAHDLQQELEAGIEPMADLPLRDAYRAQAQFLSAHRGEVEVILERARARLSAHVITIAEFNDLLDAADRLERKAIQAQGNAARIDATKPVIPARSLGAMAADLQRLRAQHEEMLSSLRSLDAWTLRLHGGLIPVAERGLQWFGRVELSYSLGGLFRSVPERRYRHARREELLAGRSELPAKLERIRAQLAAQSEQAETELRVVTTRLGQLRTTQRELETSAAALAAHLRDGLAIAALAAESEQAFLEMLAASTTTRSRQRD